MTLTHGTPVIVLAGGASRRMGVDKRSVLIDGEPMLQRVLGHLGAAPILLVIDPRRPLPPAVMAHDVHLVQDTRPGEGPLAAMEAGLAATQADVVLVMAGDMPWLEPALADLLVARLAQDPQADLVCLALGERSQPLPMACRRAPTLVRVTALLDARERRLTALLDDPATTIIPQREWRALDPDGRSLLDIDTPADLARAG